ILKRVASSDALAPHGQPAQNAKLSPLAVLQFVDNDDRERRGDPFLHDCLLKKTSSEVTSRVERLRQLLGNERARQRAPSGDDAPGEAIDGDSLETAPQLRDPTKPLAKPTPAAVHFR